MDKTLGRRCLLLQGVFDFMLYLFTLFNISIYYANETNTRTYVFQTDGVLDICSQAYLKTRFKQNKFDKRINLRVSLKNCSHPTIFH